MACRGRNMQWRKKENKEIITKNFCDWRHPQISHIYTACFGLIGYLQVSKLVIRDRAYMTTVTAVGFYLGWYCAAAMNVFSFTVLLVEFFSCFGMWHLQDDRPSRNLHLLQQTNTSKTATPLLNFKFKNYKSRTRRSSWQMLIFRHFLNVLWHDKR
jgi:hypothetical protein